MLALEELWTDLEKEHRSVQDGCGGWICSPVVY
jgi:hypothetical protein